MEGPLHAFQYQPLESVNTIRVVILEPAEDHDDPLKAQLLHVNRERLSLGAEKIAIYEAVSYCWDDPTPASSLIVDENLDLPITRNVDVLLRYLRSRTKHRYLWIDGICMDQQNNGEKEVQVRLMGRIYAQATKVHVWLGVETRDDNVHGVFNALKWMAMCLKNKTLPTLGDLDYFFKFQCGPDWPAKIRQFFARPYFSRRWILQEIALGHHTTIRCGPWKLSWQWFIGGVIGLQRMIDGEILLGFTETHSRLNTIVAIEDSTNHKLLALLWRFHESRCSVAHDTIFALYGLAQDAL
ncbi:HET-domain-containing protein, partial [Bimuria novae-zelandiae CBS 107.79]